MTIKKVADLYSLSEDTLRYYERIGLIPQVKKDSSGIRNYSDSDCGWIEYVKCMRSAGVSIKALKKYFELVNMGEGTVAERKKLLEDEREKLVERRNNLNETLNRLDHKIEGYEKLVLSYERTLK